MHCHHNKSTHHKRTGFHVHPSPSNWAPALLLCGAESQTHLTGMHRQPPRQPPHKSTARCTRAPHISLGCCLGAAVKTCRDAVKHRFSGAQAPSNWAESQTLCHHTQEQRVKHSSMGCTAITTRAHNTHTTRGTGQVFRCTTNWVPPPHKNTVYGKIPLQYITV